MPTACPFSDVLLPLKQILGDPKAVPPIPAMIPVSYSTWWAGVKDKRYPAPVKISERRRAWRLSEIMALIEK